MTDNEIIKVCKDCLHFDICCEDWANETEGKFTADDFRVSMADKVPCANHFKSIAEIKADVRKEVVDMLERKCKDFYSQAQHRYIACVPIEDVYNILNEMEKKNEITKTNNIEHN